MSLKVFIAQPRLKEHYDKYIEQFKAKEKAEKNIEVNVQLEMPPADNAPQILKTRLASNDAQTCLHFMRSMKFHRSAKQVIWKTSRVNLLSINYWIPLTFRNGCIG